MDRIRKTRTLLANGIPLVVIEVPWSKSAVINYWSRAGTRLNPRGKEGLAHFLEHILLKKTRKYPTDIALARELEKYGAWKNAWTGRDTINFEIESSFKDTGLTLKILSEIVFDPLIEPRGISKEREVIKKEIIRKENNPEELVWDVSFRVFYYGTPLQNSNLGSEKSLDNISQFDLINFWKKHFISNHSMVIVSGGVKKEKIEELVGDYFGKQKISRTPEPPSFNYKKANKKRMIIEKKDISQASMLLSFRLKEGKINKDFYPLLVLRAIVCSGWSSRIPQRLRVKESLVYNWHSSIERMQDTAAITFGLSTANKKFPKMISILGEEISKLRRSGVSNTELKVAKGYIDGQTLINMETSRDYLYWYAKDELFWPDTVESVEERLRKIKNVKVSDVNKIIEKYFTKDNWHLAAVGNITDEDVDIKI